MNEFVCGTYRDLTGMVVVGGFVVEGRVGRDSSGAPRWRISCKCCGWQQTLSHSKLAPLVESRATQATLQCSNGECPLSRQHHESESISQMRRQERLEAERAANAADEAQRAAEEKAAKGRQQTAKLEALKNEWRGYWLHQICTDIEADKIASFERWQRLSPETRRAVLDRINADPACYFPGL